MYRSVGEPIGLEIMDGHLPRAGPGEWYSDGATNKEVPLAVL